MSTILPGRILEPTKLITPRGSPVTVSNGISPGSVHYCSDRKELRMREWTAGVFDHEELDRPRSRPAPALKKVHMKLSLLSVPFFAAFILTGCNSGTTDDSSRPQ